MNDFRMIQTLAATVHFTVFKAYAKKLHFKVLLKQYLKNEEAEFLVRSVPMKTKNNIYFQPLISILADVDTASTHTFIVFVWQKEKSLEGIVEQDPESMLAPGRAGFNNLEVIYKSPLIKASGRQAYCLTLGRKVILKVFKHLDVLEMNLTFSEALTLVQCTHPNICEILDFRQFSTKKGKYQAYIAMELMDRDLAKEIQEQKSLAQPYGESELLRILENVSSALIHAKSKNVAHRDIKPSNILSTPRGLKISNFVSPWLKGLMASRSQDLYQRPETWKVKPEILQRAFESDVLSLGMPILHLATLESPPSAEGMSEGELQSRLQREVSKLRYSEEFKRLTMTSVASHERPPIETVVAVRLQHQASERKKADQLAQQALSAFEVEMYPEASVLHSAAHAIYSRLSDDKATANHLRSWGRTLRRMEDDTEAEGKHAAAHALYCRFSRDKDTAINLTNWAITLSNMRLYEEAGTKLTAAEEIFSHFPNDKDTAYHLATWGLVLYNMQNYVEAERKFAEADAISSRFFINDADTACNLIRWGYALEVMGRSQEAISKYAEADTIYTRLPASKIPLCYLLKWIEVLGKMNNNEKAVRMLAAAETHYSRQLNHKFAAKVLYERGNTLKKMRNNAEALMKFEAADATFSALFPDDKDTAVNLNAWGHALMELDNYEEAVGKLAAADSILSRLCPDSFDCAINCSTWAFALSRTANNEEAERKFAAASAMFSRLPRVTVAAENLYFWGNALKKLGNYAEAAKKYRSADSIYSQFPSDSGAADNLYFWGEALTRMERQTEAVEKYEAARGAYASLGKSNDAEDCDRAISKLLGWSYSAESIWKIDIPDTNSF